MNKVRLLSYLLLLLATACVDRLSNDIGSGVRLGIVVDGFISDQPGPYEVKLSSLFDIQSKESTRVPVAAKRLTIIGMNGEAEELSSIGEGIYQTSPTGIQGKSGGVYKLRIELFDGRVYESVPDTLIVAGQMEDIHLTYSEQYNEIGIKEYFLNVSFDSNYESGKNDKFLWRFMATYKADTHPELYQGRSCFWLDEIGRCNYLPPCSGLRNVGTNVKPEFERKYDCTCCTCWYNIFNVLPIISDPHLLTEGSMKNVQAGVVPMNQWTLMHKIRVEVAQMSLSRSTFRFWKAIKDQKKANGNLFQPITGKIPAGFVQLSGNPAPVEGIFFATAINSKVQYVDRFDLPPNLVYAIPLEDPIYRDDCRLLVPNSTNLTPPFWKD